jgi:hypothetical protein
LYLLRRQILKKDLKLLDQDTGNTWQNLNLCKSRASNRVVMLPDNDALTEGTTTVLSSPVDTSKQKDDFITPFQRLKKHFLTKEFFNIIMLSFGFQLTFAAYGPAQGLMTSIHKDLGFICLAILYGTFAFTNFTAPAVSTFLGPKWGIVVGSIPYAIFCLAAGFDEPVILISASVMMGFAASLLWVSQGELLTRCGQRVNMGFYSGIFCCIQGLSGVVGNAIMGGLLSYNVQQWYAFIVMFCIGLVSQVFFLPMRFDLHPCIITY